MKEIPLILPDLDLQPGDLYLTREPAILRTILGSCVGVTFWSRRLGAGALCHGVLPRCPAAALTNPSNREWHRYVDFSIRHLAQQFDGLGASRNELQVKLFGGADVLPNDRIDKPTVGALNCMVALEVVEAEGLTVFASDLGGNRGRRIHFHTGTGEVLLHRLAAWSKPHLRHDDFSRA